MRFMFIVKSAHPGPPTPELIEAMHKLGLASDPGAQITPTTARKREKTWLTTTLCSRKACQSGVRC